MTDVDLYRQFQKSPIFFIERMWGLTPQPAKPEFQNVVSQMVAAGDLILVSKDYFDPFVKGQHITWQQWLILVAVERAIQGLSTKKISAVAGHGVGKSADLAWLVIWYLFCFKDSQVGATAPTSQQIHDVLWKEIALWLGRMPQHFSKLFEWSSGYVRIKERPDTWFARARTAGKDNPEAMAGLHGEFVFILVDEASGVDDVIYRSAEGSLTGDNTLVVLISNGTQNQGYFYNTHHSDKANWVHLSFDSSESPIVDPEYINRIIQLYGTESDEYKIRVGGKFPNSEQMDESGWIPLITERQITQVSEGLPFTGQTKMGSDPSGEGDDGSFWVARDRFMAKVVGKELTSNAKTVAKKTVDLAVSLEIKPEDITTDSFGVGADVSKECLLLNHEFSINSINWGNSPVDETRFANIKSEVCFRGRDWIISGGAIVGDELKRDLLSYRYKNQPNGKKIMMPKVDQKKLLGRSPDRGDAFFLSHYVPDATEAMMRRKTSNVEFDPFEAI